MMSACTERIESRCLGALFVHAGKLINFFLDKVQNAVCVMFAILRHKTLRRADTTNLLPIGV